MVARVDSLNLGHKQSVISKLGGLPERRTDLPLTTEDEEEEEEEEKG